MPLTIHSTSRSRRPNAEPRLARGLSPDGRLARLREELTRQRALLLADQNLSFVPPDEQTHFADPADQASNDCERDLSYHVRTRMITKLKRIERALLLLRTTHYGYCRRCRKPIPDERLAVQPEALLCVPCLAHIERRAGTGAAVGPRIA